MGKLEYYNFIREKINLAKKTGFEVHDSELHDILKPHQRDIVKWALSGGCRAIFASFGLGKSLMQLQTLKTIGEREGGKQLIIAPLGVRQEFTKIDGPKIGIDLEFVRKTSEVQTDGMYITNYESVRDGKLDPNIFNGVSLDEAAILRSYGSKTYQEFLGLFKNVKYKFVATATPSPNRYKELIHYAGFLGICDTGQALTRYFQRDSTKANNLTLYPHKEKEFWLWVSSWALFVNKPSDLGNSDDGYNLPKLNVFWHKLKSTGDFKHDKDGQYMLFNDVSMSLSSSAKEKRENIDVRIEKMVEIINEKPNDNFILWHDQEEERKSIKKAVPSASEVYGSLDLETREQRIIDFSYGKAQYLATKPVLSGSGCNFQRYCNNSIFLGVGYKFADFIQAIHRIYRFLQEKECNIHIIYLDSESQIVKVLKEKWTNHNKMVEKMTNIIKKYGLSHTQMEAELSRTLGIERIEVSGENYKMINNDCVVESMDMESDSIGLIHTSIPFSNHYEYTPCYDDTTEVLTRRGWKLFSETNLKDSFATINQESLLMEWQKPSEIIWRPYKGDMLHFYQKGVYDLLVTPDHKMFVDTRVGNKLTGRKNQKFELLQAKDFENNFIHRKWKMLSSVEDKQDYNDVYFVEIPEAELGKRGIKAKKINPIQIDDFLRLGGWYLSEGCCDHINDTYSKHDGRITISQSSSVNPLNVKEIKDLFIKIGLKPTIRDKSITVHSKSLSLFLVKTFGSNSYHKFIPQWIKDLPVKRLKVIRDTMMKGDGSTNGMAYTSFSEQLQNDFQEICFYSGWRTVLSKKYNTIRISQNRVSPEIRTAPKKIYYDGMIGCATVPNHTLVVRRNGKVIVSGNCYNDFGHTESNAHFWEQMDFLTPELYRILIPGRIAAIHIKDRILFGNVTGCGFPTCDNMLEETSLHFQKHGFKKIGIITVVTDVVRENNQTYRLGWTEQCKDGSKMGVGCPEYVLLFRKPQTDKTRGFSDIPVVKSKEEYTRAHWQVDAHAFWRSSGNRFIGADELSSLPHDVLSRVFTKFTLDTIYDNEVHVKIGEDLDLKGKLPSTFMSIAPGSLHPQVWTDVNRMKTMNSNQSRRNVQLHVCLAEGSLILTGEGFKSIESINIGDLVFTHKGNWKPVIAKEHTGFKEVVRTKATGVPNLVTTPTHKIWTRSGKDKHHPTRKFNDPEWKEAKDLEKCYVNQKIPPVMSGEILTDREWWIVGRFLADGHVGTRNDFFISVGNHKYQEFEDNVGVDFFGNKHVIGNSTQFRLKNVSSDLKAILGKCGKLAHEKQVPIEGICLNERQSEFLLAGYLSGDGHVDKHGKTHATSVSRALLLGMSIVIQRCKNKIASIYTGRKPGEKIIEGRKVNTRQDWIMLIPKDNAHHSFGKILEDGAWKRVSEIQGAGFSNVWNIRVLDDESYMAEGCIVKNCPLQIDIVDRIITRYSNKDEIIFDPFGGLGTVPLRAMKLGRKGIATELNNGYFMDACRYLQGLEIEMNSPTIFDIIGEEVGE